MEEYGFEFGAMAAHNEIRICAPDETAARAWAEQAIAEVRRIEAKYSRYRADSVTTRINRAAGHEPIEVDDETAALLDFAARLFDESAGRFDLTSGVLRRVWDFKAQRVPAPSEIDAVLPLIGWRKLRWQRPRLHLPQAGMEIDFGGVGKEYAADRAAAALAECGARHGFVNLGGDVRAFGPQPDGTPWHIAIAHPRSAGEMIGSVDVSAGAVATSGDYERYFERDGQRYCHILDPRDGRPVRFWQAVSVQTSVCTAAGACATIAMLMPVDEALGFLRGQGVQYLAVAAGGEIYGNSSMPTSN